MALLRGKNACVLLVMLVCHVTRSAPELRQEFFVLVMVGAMTKIPVMEHVFVMQTTLHMTAPISVQFKDANLITKCSILNAQ